MSDSQSQSQSQSETDMEAKTRQKNIEKVIISVPDDIAEQLSNPDNDQQPTFQVSFISLNQKSHITISS